MPIYLPPIEAFGAGSKALAQSIAQLPQSIAQAEQYKRQQEQYSALDTFKSNFQRLTAGKGDLTPVQMADFVVQAAYPTGNKEIIINALNFKVNMDAAQGNLKASVRQEEIRNWEFNRAKEKDARENKVNEIKAGSDNVYERLIANGFRDEAEDYKQEQLTTKAAELDIDIANKRLTEIDKFAAQLKDVDNFYNEVSKLFEEAEKSGKDVNDTDVLKIAGKYPGARGEVNKVLGIGRTKAIQDYKNELLRISNETRAQKAQQAHRIELAVSIEGTAYYNIKHKIFPEIKEKWRDTSGRGIDKFVDSYIAWDEWRKSEHPNFEHLPSLVREFAFAMEDYLDYTRPDGFKLEALGFRDYLDRAALGKSIEYSRKSLADNLYGKFGASRESDEFDQTIDILPSSTSDIMDEAFPQ